MYVAEGGDVATTLTTQGDILYRDGSGLARLGAGTSGQALLTGGAGANPSWGNVSSKILRNNQIIITLFHQTLVQIQIHIKILDLQLHSHRGIASNDFLILADLGVTRHASTSASFLHKY